MHKEQCLMKTLKEMASLLHSVNNEPPLIVPRRTSVSIMEQKPKRSRGRGKSLSIAT